MNRVQKSGVAILTASMLLVWYTNCATNYSNPAEEELASVFSSGNPCEEDIVDFYAKTWHPFLSDTCKSCHVNGPGKGTFAAPAVDLSYEAFNQIGYEKISDFAISESHNPPYTGAHNLQQVSDLKLQWQKRITEMAQCKNGALAPSSNQLKGPFITTTSKTIGLSSTATTTKTITWALSSELTALASGLSVPDLTGAQFSITVGIFKPAGGKPVYAISKPTLFGAANDLNIKSVVVFINGRRSEQETTFNYVDQDVRRGSNATQGLLSSGTLVALAEVKTTDKISIGIKEINSITLPPPGPAIQVQFASASTLTAPKGEMRVMLEVNQSITSPLTVGVSVDNSALPQGSTFLRPNSVLGTSYNRFDWDYKFTSTNVTFAAGETTKDISIIFSSDIRKESNKLLTLRLGTPFGGVLGTNQSVNIQILKQSNPDPTPGVPTFSQLMNSVDGLKGNCLGCHNSRDRRGGYDMTDYQEMIDRRILIPGDVNSKMYRRMNADAPNLENLAPMPLNGFLPRAYVTPVEMWILDGAKNN